MSQQTNADRIVREAAHNRIFRVSARAAYPISGILHLVVSYIISPVPRRLWPVAAGAPRRSGSSRWGYSR